jgi:hypothetical protein
MFKFVHLSPLRLTHALAATIVMLLVPLAAPAQHQMVTMETLLDRIYIQDLLTLYYDDLSRGAGHALADYFTEDAVLDVDGTVATGHAEIAALYGRPPEQDARREPGPTGPVRRGQMLLTNPIIEVNGDTATAHVIWTGVLNEGIGTVPSLYEQGREFTELVKRDGKWLIKHRYISSDSGLPDRFDETYYPREHR